MHDDVSDDESLAGMYPLHEACKTSSVPVEVIRALIRANPSSLSYRTVSGLTPFHLLLCSNVNATVEHVKCFLDASPGCLFKCNVEICDDELMVVEPSPMHLACGNPNVNWDVVELMLRHAPDAALLRYVADRCTPFHYALMKNAPTETLRYFLEASPSIVYMNTENSESPLHLLCKSLQRRVDLALINSFLDIDVNLLGLAAGKLDYERTPLHLLCMNEETNVEIIKYCVLACPRALFIADQVGNLPIHYATANQFPISLLELMLENHPESVFTLNDLSQSVLDLWCISLSNKSNFAETIARYSKVSNVAAGNSFFRFFMKGMLLFLSYESRKDNVNLEVKEFDAEKAAFFAASRVGLHPLVYYVLFQNLYFSVNSGMTNAHKCDSEGRCLLNRGIEAGIPWQVINAIIFKNPDLLLRVDKKRNLFPFMVPTVKEHIGTSGHGDDDGIASVSLSFELLRAAPEVIRCSCPN